MGGETDPYPITRLVLLQNDAEVRLVITKMGEIMADRGFPLKDLEMELKNLEREAAEGACWLLPVKVPKWPKALSTH